MYPGIGNDPRRAFDSLPQAQAWEFQVQQEYQAALASANQRLPTLVMLGFGEFDVICQTLYYAKIIRYNLCGDRGGIFSCTIAARTVENETQRGNQGWGGFAPGVIDLHPPPGVVNPQLTLQSFVVRGE